MKETIILIYAVTLLFHFGSLRAQVTIGAEKQPQTFSILEIVSSGTGGLRLPHLTTVQRDSITGEPSFTGFVANEGRGLAIFNIDTQCFEYWNDDRWISLCEGTARMTLNPDPCNNIAADGTGCDNDFDVDDPDCLNGPFTFTVLIGREYASLYDVDENDGIFKISFQPNNSINPRIAVVRVTSGCTGQSSDFLFTQLGQLCNFAPGSAPVITSYPAGKNISFCAGGAVYLSVPSGTPDLDKVVWTRNGIEIDRGVSSITVTSAGVYDVHMDVVGCGQLSGNAVTVTRNGTGAPQPVSFIVAGNNGVICTPGGYVTLVAENPNAGGTVLWFKDGIYSGYTGTTLLMATAGAWYAVVQNGACLSRPSETVTVVYDPSPSGQLTAPSTNVNSLNFCAGGVVELKVISQIPGYTYSWYANNTLIGSGSSVLYSVPSGILSVVIRCRATAAGYCAAETMDIKQVSAGVIPAMPQITGNRVLCSGTATLNIVPSGSGSFTYAWYKDGQQIGTSQQITINSGGDYYASVSSGGCSSPLAHINIPSASSSAPIVTLTSSSSTPGSVSVGSVVTYNANLTPGPATGYTWNVIGIGVALQSGGQPGDTQAVVAFGTAGQATVAVTGSNQCGSHQAFEIVTVASGCARILNVSPSPTLNSSASAIVNSTVTLGPVSAVFDSGNTAQASYQWYSNTANNNNLATATLIPGATGNTYTVTSTSAGTYYYFCAVSNAASGCSSEKLNTGTYAVNVTLIPSLMGTGSFTGHTCFDIAYSNSGGSCGTPAGRYSQRADFSVRSSQDPSSGSVSAPYSGVQVYTFTPSGTVSNVRFTYLDQSNEAIESMTANGTYTGNNISTPCKVTVNYRSSLNVYLHGRTREQAIKPELYVIYNDNANNTGTDRYLKLTASLQDCACCGAATVGGGWLTFKCHNLGANENLDPFTYVEGNVDGSGGTLGYLYQWGRKEDGHQKRNSGTTSTLATSNTPGHSSFILNMSPYNDWRSGSTPAGRWGDGSANPTSKGPNDPCPAGWKVPSQAQWGSIFRGGTTTAGQSPGSAIANTWTWTGNGYRVGSGLFLPAAGIRFYAYSAPVTGVAKNGYYWSSSVSNAWDTKITEFSATDVKVNTLGTIRAYGMSVRCVSE